MGNRASTDAHTDTNASNHNNYLDHYNDNNNLGDSNTKTEMLLSTWLEHATQTQQQGGKCLVVHHGKVCASYVPCLGHSGLRALVLAVPPLAIIGHRLLASLHWTPADRFRAGLALRLLP
jgi:hypothetical protein